jgi:PAS domain S-box-containing protein
MAGTDTTGRSSDRSFLAAAATVLALAVAYALVVKVVQPATTLPGDVAPIFPAAGLALAAVLVLGRPALLGIWLGSYAANAITYAPDLAGVFLPPPRSALVSASIATGAALAAATAAWLVRRACREEHPLQSARNVLTLVALGALGSAVIKATTGMLTLSLAGITPWRIFGYAWITWLLGDAFGVVIAAPLLLAWWGGGPLRIGWRRVPELLALSAATLALCHAVFFRGLAFEYGLMPLLIWAAFRFGLRGTTLAAAAIALLATIGTAMGTSPFVRATPNESMLVLHSFLGVTIIFTLMLGGVLSERQRIGESQRRLAIAVEQAGDAIAIVDSGAGVVYVNGAFEAQSGHARADAVGKPLADLGWLRPEDEVHLRARLEASGVVEGVELEVTRRDGTPATVQLSARRARNGGAPVSVFIARDVTNERRLAEAMRHAQRVEAMGTLAAGIAHNFRNALAAVVPNLALALQEAPEALRPPLEDAFKAATSAVALATELTRMSRQEGEAPVEQVDVAAVARDVASLCRGTFGARHRIEEEVDPELGSVLGRSAQLHQALLNLCLNARDATSGVAEPRITLSARRLAGGAQAEIVLSDNGCGMGPETLRRLGEPFFTTKQAGRGTGLGLSTAFAAVRSAGGRMSVESRAGFGTTFRILLPLQDARGLAAGSVATAPLPRLGGRVIALDDDLPALDTLARQLASLGVEAERFADPFLALERLSRAPAEVQLLITDLDMPGLSGAELVERARAMAPGLSVIVLSGTPDPKMPRAPDAFLLKPVATPDLAEALERCLLLPERVSRTEPAPGTP